MCYAASKGASLGMRPAVWYELVDTYNQSLWGTIRVYEVPSGRWSRIAWAKMANLRASRTQIVSEGLPQISYHNYTHPLYYQPPKMKVLIHMSAHPFLENN